MRRLLHTLFLNSGREERFSRLLRRGASVGMLAMVIISFTAVNLQALLWQSSDWLVGAVLPGVVVEMTNKERVELAENPLIRNSVLDEAARLKAEHMASNEYFSHYSPDGVSPWHWFDKTGYVYAYAGENLAIHFSDSGEVVDAWMKSPTHRANIVSKNYTEIGVGTAKGIFEGFETIFVVQMFGSPATPSAVVEEPLLVPPPTTAVATTATATVLVVLTPKESSNNDPVREEVGVVLAAESREVSSESGSSTPSTTPNETPAFVTTTTSASLTTDIDHVTTPQTAPSSLSSGEIENGLVLKAPDYQVPEPVFEVAAMEVEQDMVSVYSGMMATSSGFPMFVKAPGEASGTTKIAVIGRLATQPSFVLQLAYAFLGSVVAFMLFLSLLLGLRSERPWQIVYSVALLVAMGGLVTVHVFLTSGAVVI